MESRRKVEMEEIILFRKKEECCGCSACAAICPKQSITMQEDEEGFEYPVIDANRCVKCRACIAVCPVTKCQS